MTDAKAFITDCDGLEFSAEERSFLDAERPWGFILFGRNVDSPAQVSALTQSFREIVGRPDAPVLIDQEGGRVQRLAPPCWRRYPSARDIGDTFVRNPDGARRAAWLKARGLAADLIALGIDVDCLPCLDVPVAGAHEVIGERAFSVDPEVVAILGRETVNGLMAGGVLPVIKHVPGHGRADADTHFDLPTVKTSLAELERTDFAAFRPFADAPMAMTVHLVLAAVDPHRPATQSPKVIEEIIRGHLGFDGLLMTDDLSMQALGGGAAERASKCIRAGCDVILHCNDTLENRYAVASVSPILSGNAARRAEAAVAARKAPEPFDVDAGWDELCSLLDVRVAA